MMNENKFVFTEPWIGNINYYYKLNGFDANRFDYSNKFKNIIVPKFEIAWLEFVGGFTDSYFFNKKNIENLSDKDKEIIFNFIEDAKKMYEAEKKKK